MQGAQQLADFISRIDLGPSTDLGDIVVVALLGREGGPDADLLEEGLAGGRTIVTEAEHQGRVNEVRVRHAGPKLLLLVDGEELLGAKQNRVFNASFLVAAGQEVEIPVSCVERGRWQYTSQTFASSGRTMTRNSRNAKLLRVSESVRSAGTYDANQRQVWSDVDGFLERTGTRSCTSALADGVASRAASVDERLQRLAPVEHQVGIAVVRGGKLVGLDAFGSPTLWARAWQKIARGTLAEMWEGDNVACDPKSVVSNALRAIAAMAPIVKKAPGCGSTLHGVAGDIAFGGVEFEGQVYHATAAAISVRE